MRRECSLLEAHVGPRGPASWKDAAGAWACGAARLLGAQHQASCGGPCAGALENALKLIRGQLPGSSGLGLSVSHAIVTSLGGTLRAESREGRGTLITVTLPAAAEVPQSRPQVRLAAG